MLYPIWGFHPKVAPAKLYIRRTNLSRLTSLSSALKTTLKAVGIFLGLSFCVGLIEAFRYSNQTVPLSPEHSILETIDKEKINLLEASHDKPVILYTWATWCGICLTTSPTISAFSSSYTAIGIAVKSGPDSKVSEYARKKGYRFHLISDEEALLAKQWQVQVFPTIHILHEGKIKLITTGILSPVGLWLRLMIARIL